MKKHYFIRSTNLKTGNFIIVFLLAFLTWYAYSLSFIDFKKPYSTVVTAQQGQMLGARIASDGQWRFQPMDSLPYKFTKCLLTYEDRFFYHHPGINPVSIFRAIYLNLKHKSIISGGSTITMQVIRLLNGSGDRTIWRKLYEMVLATRLELACSKDEIIRLHASHAPFGGNIVGVWAASWKYYNRNPFQLSWAEAATLAVLPNAPSMVHPGKNRKNLREKRDFLLKKLLNQHVIDSLEYKVAIIEPLPQKPYSLPLTAKHLTDKIHFKKRGKWTVTTIDYHLQLRAEQIIHQHYKKLIYNYIHNIAALIVENGTGNVLTYIGNTYQSGRDNHHEVDIITSPRSTGSILKPVLYAAMLNDGKLSPESLVPDIPVRIADYRPENFTGHYDGAVKAKNALARSLNVPAVLMLRTFDVGRFYKHLENLGITSLKYPPEHYGLSLILGGAEMSLWELANTYSFYAQKLNKYNKGNNTLYGLNYIEDNQKEIFNDYLTGEGSIYLMFQALLEVNRPEQGSGWKYFSSTRKVAWKTGTSFGFKDAWAIGATPEYLVAVWAGNADGEGRPGITGINVAAPVMFDLFDLLPPTTWFKKPYDEMQPVVICKQSGYAASHLCPEKDTIYAVPGTRRLKTCKYHKTITLDNTGKFRVNKACYHGKIKNEPWFILPPHIEHYYKQSHAGYQSLPPWHPSCKGQHGEVMEFVFPVNVQKIYIPKDLDGGRSEILFQVAHREPVKNVYWHLDEQYLGKTKLIHEMGFFVEHGNHTLTIVDEDGAMLSTTFEVVDKHE